MPRLLSRLLVPALALIALGFLVPALAQALPLGGADLSAAERHEAAPGRLSQLWRLLSTLWDETGSILDPNGGTSSGAVSEPTASSRESAGSTGAQPTASSGDNGSILDPDGRP